MIIKYEEVLNIFHNAISAKALIKNKLTAISMPILIFTDDDFDNSMVMAL